MTNVQTEQALLKLLFWNSAFAGIGDAGGLLPSATAGSLYVSLHTADPGSTGNQDTNEATYGGYARVAVARDSSQWAIGGSSPSDAANVNPITFPACASGSETITYFAVGTDSSGTGKLLFKGALSASLAVSAGVTPQFSSGDLACQVG